VENAYFDVVLAQFAPDTAVAAMVLANQTGHLCVPFISGLHDSLPTTANVLDVLKQIRREADEGATLKCGKGSKLRLHLILSDRVDEAKLVDARTVLAGRESFGMQLVSVVGPTPLISTWRECAEREGFNEASIGDTFVAVYSKVLISDLVEMIADADRARRGESVKDEGLRALVEQIRSGLRANMVTMLIRRMHQTCFRSSRPDGLAGRAGEA
jgi:hypothetical protein